MRKMHFSTFIAYYIALGLLVANIAAEVHAITLDIHRTPEIERFKQPENQKIYGTMQSGVYANGVARYCSYGMKLYINRRCEEAIKGIEQSCKGAYSIVDEIDSSDPNNHFSFGNCASYKGIYFSCAKEEPVSTADFAKTWWTAIAISPARNETGMASGEDKKLTENAAIQKCKWSDCTIVLSLQGESCISMGYGRNAAGQRLFFIRNAPTIAAAEKLTQDECNAEGGSCEKFQSTCLKPGG